MNSFPGARFHRTSCGDRCGGQRRAADFKTSPCFFSRRKRPWPSGAPTRRRKNHPHDGAPLAISAAAFPVQKMQQAARRKGLRRGLHRRSGCGCGRSRGGDLSSLFGETAGYASPTFRGALSAAPKNRKIHRDLQIIFANPMGSIAIASPYVL